MRKQRVRTWVAGLLAVFSAGSASAQAPRKIGELELSLAGLSARLDPPNPAIPKNTAAGVRVVVSAGSRELDAFEVAAFLGSGFEVRAELSGPGLPRTLTLPGPEAPSTGDPLILPLPAIAIAGDYALSNLRVVARGQAVLDVAPSHTTLRVIDQILVTSVKTRALTLDEIRAKGIVLDSDDYLGFEFDLGLRLESKAVQVSFPVVFDRGGVAVPQPRPIGAEIRRSGVDVPPMTIVPGLLAAPMPTGSLRQPELKLPSGEPIRIPSVLVIPGNVGYLKQFFSAQLFVANGAPVGSGLDVRDITGSIHLPPGDDLEPETADDPLALPETVRGPQPAVLPIRHVGPDGEPDTADDHSVLRPAEQGQAEFLVRGEREGFHKLDFDIAATLDGLATGPVVVSGRASGGVLVRNPYFDLSFVVPSVVRAQEEFKLFVTVTNIGQGAANLLNIALDEAALSGAVLLEAPEPIDTLAAGDSRTVSFRLRSLRTGQVTASYLRFDTDSGASGDLRFRLGVGERGVPLSPDTLVLPASVEELPQPVIDAAMRVLGQAWSAANAPGGLLPRGVIRPRADAVVTRALALAEAGLRVTLGQPVEDAVADLATDFVVGEPRDGGFEQILFETDAGRELGTALGAAFGAHAASDVLAFELATGRTRASALDFVSFATEGPLTARLADAHGVVRDLAIPLSVDASLGLSPAPAGPLTLTLEAAGAGSASLAVTVPRGDGRALRGTVHFEASATGRGSLTFDPADPLRLELLWDDQGDGVALTRLTLATSLVAPSGPQLLAAAVIGPETLAGAPPHGTQALALFDRPVSATAAADRARYTASGNAVRLARRQLSGRLVFLTLDQPEGRFVEQVLATVGLPDPRGNAGVAGSVALTVRNADPGAIVSGRVLEADGTPLAALVTLANQVDTTCINTPANAGIAATPTDAVGRYQFRYVRQDNCGFPFEVAVRDPDTGSLRRSATHVRYDGQVIAIDLVMLGTGSVSGVVRNLSGQPVPGAGVVVLSQTDPQISGSGTTDGDGRYTIRGISVGAVNVSAAKGTGLGRASGRIDRAGQTASIDISIDSGSVRAEGIVRKLAEGAFTPASGALVVFNVFEPDSAEPLPVGYDTTDALGRYEIDNLPTGAYGMVAHFGGRTATASGTASAGDTVHADLLVELDAGGTQYANVRGTVRLPDGSPAPRAIVRLAGSPYGAQASADGRYELRGLPVRPSIVSIEAASADGARRGTASVTVVAGGIDGVDVTLSGVGTAVFTALDPGGAPIAGLTVSRSAGACGIYEDARTDADGRVAFVNVPLGSTRAVATRTTAAGTDFQVATASVLRDGESGFGVMRFAGFGIVSGTIVDAAGAPLPAIQVALTSRAYSGSECDFVSRVTHQATTDASGRFRFANVNVGAVVVVATDAYSGVRSTARGTLASAGQDLALQIKLVDTTAGVLSGLVLQPDGETPAGAGVEVSVDGPLPEVTVRTTADGRYAFARVLPQGRYTLTARDPQSGGRVRTTVYLRAGLDSEQDLRLKGTGQVRVRVVDGADVPVERAQVVLRELDYPSGRQELAVEAASEGVALFDGVFEGPLAISVRDVFGRGGRASATLGRPGTVLDVKVRVTTTGTVTGVFRMPSGEPISFGTVRLSGPAGANGQVTTDGVGDIGRFSFDFVPAGSFRLEAQDPLTARAGVAVGSIATEGQVVEVDVRAEGLGRVQGVVTGNGVPEPGARVEVASGRYRAATMSDASGLYDVEGVPVGRVVVSAALAGGFLRGSASATLAADGDTIDLPVALRDSGRVVGQVVAPDGTPPGPPSQVAIRVGGNGGGGESQASDLEGRFEFQQVAEGTASLSADVYGSIDRGRATAEVVGGETVEVALPVNGVGALDVQIKDGAGQPTGGRLTVTGTGAFGWSYTVQVPGTGHYRFPELLAGPLTARVAIPAGLVTHYGSTGDVLAPGETKAIEVQVQPTATGSVIGRVVRADGTTPALGTQVSLLLSGNRKVLEQVQIDGSFDSPGLPLGALSLELEDPLTGGIARVSGLALATAGQVLDVGTLVLDHDLPTVQILEPAAGAVRKSLSGGLTVAVADQGSGIDPTSLRVEYPGRHVSTMPAPADGTSSMALDPNRLLVGANRLKVTARDLAGNSTTSDVTFTVIGSILRGRVVGPTALPAAGVTVVRAPHTAQGSATASVVTSADGSFEFGGARPGSYAVSATDPASGLTIGRTVTLVDGEDATADFSLPAYAHVEGFVTRADSSPAAGVLVTAGERSATTAANGAFSLRHLALGAWTLQASDPANGDRGVLSVTLAVHDSTATPAIRLNGVGAVTVEVRDAAGLAVPGAAVHLDSSSPFGAVLHATADALGRARFSPVFAGSLSVSASDPVTGLEGGTTGAVADGQDLSLVVSLEPAGRIVGTVHAALGGPIAGASVKLTGPRTVTLSSGLDGSFAFENVPLGSFTLTATLADGDRGTATGSLTVAGQTVVRDVTLTGLGTVSVLVLDAADQAQPGASVTVTSGGPTRQATTGADGRASLPGVLAGAVSARATHDGLSTPTSSGTLAAGGTATFDLKLRPSATLTGRVLASDGQTPVAGAQVFPKLGGQSFVGTTTDGQGRFTFADFSLGTYRLEVFLDSQWRGHANGLTLSTNAQVLEHDVVLAPTGTLTGVVSDESGPVVGATVRIASANPEIPQTIQRTTGAGGVYSAPHVPLGSFTVTATASGGRWGRARSAVTADGEPVSVDVVMLMATVELATHSLVDGNGYASRFTSAGGIVGQGCRDGAQPFQVVIDGVAHTLGPTQTLVATEEDKREVVLRQELAAQGLELTRKIFVPKDGYFTRTLSQVTNTGSEPVTLDVRLSDVVGSTPALVTTSSGDVVLAADDRHATLSRAGCGTHGVGVVWRDDSGAAAAPSFTAGSTGTLALEWGQVTVAPQETASFLLVRVEAADAGLLPARLARLGSLPGELLAGVDPDEVASIRNFAVPETAVVPALPLYGVVAGRVLAGDGATPVTGANVTYAPVSPYYARSVAAVRRTDGSFNVSHTVSQADDVVPRAGYALSASDSNRFGAYTATATGTFASGGFQDLVLMDGATLRASHTDGCCSSAWLGDGNADTAWTSSVSPRHIEVAFPVPATVEEVRLVAARLAGNSVTFGAGLRLDLFDALGAKLSSQTLGPVNAGAAFSIPVEPAVAGVYRVRVTDLAVAGSRTLGEFRVFGSADALSGRVDADLVFRGAGVVAGVVRNAIGTPISGAEVRIERGSAWELVTTGASGTFLFPLLSPGPATLRTTLDGGFADQVESVVVPEDGRLDHVVEFAALGTLTGTVRTAVGAPINADLLLSRDGIFSSLSASLSSGAYAFTGLATGTYRLRVTDPRTHAATERDVVIGSGTAAVEDFTLAPVGRVQVTARVEGTLLGGAAVSVTPDAGDARFCTTASGVGLGTCEVVNVGGPGFRVRASYPGASLAFAETAATLSEGATSAVTLDVPGVGHLSGTLRARDGLALGPVSNVLSVRTGSGAVARANVSVDAVGAYSAATLPLGLTRLRFTSGNARAEVETVLVAHGQTVSLDALAPRGALVEGQRDLWELTLPSGKSASVRVDGFSYGPHGALVAPRALVLDPAGEPVGPAAATVTFSAGEGGRYTVIVHAAEPEQTGGYQLTSNLNDEDHVYRLPSLPHVVGVVRNDAGHPVEGHDVVARRDDGELGAAGTDATGRYAIPVFEAGPVTLDVFDEDIQVATADVTAPAAGALEQDLVVPSRGELAVAVTRAGSPVAAVDVVLTSDHPTALPADRMRTRTTAASGEFETSMPVGTIRAQVVDPRTGAAYEATGTLVAEEGLRLTIDLPPGGVTLSGTVINTRDGAPLPGAWVELLLAGEGIAEVRTDAAGRYQFAELLDGTYKVGAFFGLSSQIATVDLAGADVVQDLALEGLPTDGMALWLRADHDLELDSDAVAAWTDHSGRGNHATPTSPNARPTFEPEVWDEETLVRPAHVRFDGVVSDLRFASRITGVRTVFWVAWEDPFATAATRPLLADSLTPSTWLGASGTPGAIWGSAANTAVRNGQTRLGGLAVTGTSALRPRVPKVISVLTTGPVAADGFGVDPAGARWHGGLTELIVYDRALDVEERAAVEDYLNATHELDSVGSLTGTLRARSGTVLPNQSATISLRDEAGAVLASSLSVGADGTFPATRVPLGVVRIRHTSGTAKAEVEAEVTEVGMTTVEDALAARGAIATGRARDLWEVTLPAGKSANVRATAVALGSFGGLTTRVVEVYRPDGLLVGSANASVSFTAPLAGRYSVIVRSSSTTATGGYELSSTLNDEDHVYRRPSLPHVTGFVRRESGVAAPGLTVRALREALVHETVTDGTGRYVAPVFSAGPVALEVLESGQRVAFVIAEAPEEGPLALDLAVPSRGTVTTTATRAGAPIGGLSVTLESDHPGALAEDRVRMVTTAAGGTASASMPVGTIVARALDPRDGSTVEAGGVLGGSGLGLTLTFAPGLRTISGSVKNASATPLPGATVEAVQGGVVVATATANAEGAYSLDGVLEGATTVRARFSTQAGETQAPLLGPATADLTLPVNIVEGTVQDAAGAPIATTVEYVCGEPGAAACVTTMSGADGRYRFMDVSYGRVRAVRDGRPSPALRAEPGGGTQVVDLTLARLEVRVLDAAGNPTPGAQVQLEVALDYGVEAGEDAYSWDSSTTAATGAVQVAALIVERPEATYRARAVLGAASAAACVGPDVDFEPDTGSCVFAVAGDTVIELALTAVTGIHGVLTDASGAPVANAMVASYADSVGTAGVTTTDADGRYVLTGLPAEGHRVEARHPGNGRTARAYVTVEADRMLDVPLRIPDASELATLRVRLVDAVTGEPVAGRTVSFEADDWALWSAEDETDTEGWLDIEGVPVDGRTFAWTGELPDGATVVWLAAGETREVEIPVGNHVAFPIDLTGADGIPLVLWPEEMFTASSGEESCDPLCMGYSGYATADREDLAVANLGSAEVLADGREGRHPWQDVAPGVRASKRAFVPASGRFGRVIDEFHNISDQPQTIFFYADQVSETDEPWSVAATSSGDLEFDADDLYVVRNNPDPEKPAVAFVIGGAGALLAPSAVGFDTGDVVAPFVEYELSLAPGQRVSVMRFVVPAAGGDVVGAQAQAASLAMLTDPDSLAGLSATDRAAIVNFAVPAQALSGHVREADGTPVANAEVFALGPGGVLSQAASAADGSFMLAGLAPGALRIVALSEQRLAHVEALLQLGQATPAVQVVLPGPAELGTVTVHATGLDGLPAMGQPVVLRYDCCASVGERLAVLDAAGTATFEGVSPQAVRVEIGDPVVGVALGVLAPGATLQLTGGNLPATDETGVRGRVLFEDGRPAAGVDVAAFGDEGGNATTTTDVGGYYALALEPGSWTLEAMDPVTRAIAGVGFEVVEGELAAIELRLPLPSALASLRAQALDVASDAPLPGRLIRVTSEAYELWDAEIVTDATGWAEVQGLPEGRVLLTTGLAPDAGFTTVHVAAGSAREVELVVGDHASLPVNLTGTDGVPYFVWGYSGVGANDAGESECNPFCSGWAGPVVDGSAVPLEHDGSARLSADAREVTLAEQEVVPGVIAWRRTFVPPSGRFARVIDFFENTSAQPITVEFHMDQVLFGDQPWEVRESASGDLALEASDTWAVMASDAGGPALGWVIAGPGGTPPTTAFSGWNGEQWSWTVARYAITLAPGARGAVLRFVVQGAPGAVAGVAELSGNLAQLVDPEALVGLAPDERAAIVNFEVEP